MRATRVLRGFGDVGAVAGCGARANTGPNRPAVAKSGAAQTRATKNAVGPDLLLLSALRSNPVTAPYAISVKPLRNGVIVLAGRVGTKQIHDVAVRMAIDLGAPFRDDLVIDTGAADQVALMSNVNAATTGVWHRVPCRRLLTFTPLRSWAGLMTRFSEWFLPL